MGAKVWDMSKETINQGNIMLFWYLFVIKAPVTIILCESIVSNPTISFKGKCHICGPYFILSSKYRVNTTTASIKKTLSFYLWLV